MGDRPQHLKPVAVIMAGGSGTRFWPLSLKNLPKQYLKLTGSRSLIQETVDRVRSLCRVEDIFIASGQSQEQLLKEQLPDISNRILEPLPRNTAACLMLSTAQLLKQGYPKDTPMMVFPADHVIENPGLFFSLLRNALAFVSQTESLVTFGIVPDCPHTGYGYIEVQDPTQKTVTHKVKRFIEKPNLETASSFLQKGGFFWNSGIFVWTLQSIAQAFEQFCSEDWKHILSSPSSEALEQIFHSLASNPIDTAVLEKASNVYMIPAQGLGWSDLGSWNALHQLKASQSEENVVMGGDVRLLESSGCLVKVPDGTQVALVGAKNLIVVLNGNVLLVADKSQDQRVKEASQFFEK